jgi:hypothetical protein
MNQTTVEELQKMDEKAFLEHLRQFPFESMWQHKDAYSTAQYILARIQGERYLTSGLLNSFETSALIHR